MIKFAKKKNNNLGLKLKKIGTKYDSLKTKISQPQSHGNKTRSVI